MQLKVVETELDESGFAVRATEMPRRFDRMDDARHEIASILAGFEACGYESRSGYWWATAEDGRQLRYNIQVEGRGLSEA